MAVLKRDASEMEDGDTRQVVVMNKRRDTSTSPPPPSQVSPPSSPTHSSASSSPGYESPPAAQSIPWDMYDDVDDDDDDDFEYSPASPPLTQTTEREEETTPPPTLYVFPDSTVVLTPDGGSVRIPDRSADQPESPEPSASRIDEETPEVCDILLKEGVGNLIVYNLQRSQLSLDEVTKRTCQDITAMMLSSEWENSLKEQIRATIPGLSKVV